MGVGYLFIGILAYFMGKISMQRITVIVCVLKHAATCIIHNFFHKKYSGQETNTKVQDFGSTILVCYIRQYADIIY